MKLQCTHDIHVLVSFCIYKCRVDCLLCWPSLLKIKWWLKPSSVQTGQVVSEKILKIFFCQNTPNYKSHSHLAWRSDVQSIILKRDNLRTIPTRFIFLNFSPRFLRKRFENNFLSKSSQFAYFCQNLYYL